MTVQALRRLRGLPRSAVAVAVASALALAVGLAGCGTQATPSGLVGSGAAATEINPPGDIPDDQVFVPFTPDSGLFTVSVPEGWARGTEGATVTFTDKLNTVRIETVALPVAPDVASATATEVPAIQAATTDYTAGEVTMVSRSAGDAVLITYGARSEPDPVTGETFNDSVERYEFWRAGQEVVLTLSGPAGADNVDPWKTITNSFAWTG